MAFVGSSGALRKADVAYVAVRVLPHNLAHRRTNVSRKLLTASI
jgi:hypothetical protein